MVKHQCLKAILTLTALFAIAPANSQTAADQPRPEQKEQAVATPEEPLLAAESDKTGDTQDSKQKQQTVKTSDKQQDTFTPTEEISEDLAVSFPVDI